MLIAVYVVQLCCLHLKVWQLSSPHGCFQQSYLFLYFVFACVITTLFWKVHNKLVSSISPLFRAGGSVFVTIILSLFLIANLKPLKKICEIFRKVASRQGTVDFASYLDSNTGIISYLWTPLWMPVAPPCFGNNRWVALWGGVFSDSVLSGLCKFCHRFAINVWVFYTMRPVFVLQHVQQILRPREKKLGLGMCLVDHLTSDICVGTPVHCK